jgi:molybdate transport system substrate-binding protein
MAETIRGVSSMATKALLAELCGLLRNERLDVRFESGGGVEVERQVREGSSPDLIVLAAGALTRLDADGFLITGTLRPMFVSDVVAAVPSSNDLPAFGTEDDVRNALVSADRIAYSTGPSGTAVHELIERWGLIESLGERLIQAPPGVPVGALLAGGEADLGFQQRSEFSATGDVRVLGPLPGDSAIQTVFSGAVHRSCLDAATGGLVLDLIAGPGMRSAVQAFGMTSAAQ